MREDVRMPDEGSRDPSRAGRRPRGLVSVYSVAFVCLVGAGAAIALAAVDLLSSTTPLWVSTALSALAIVLAIASVFLPRR